MIRCLQAEKDAWRVAAADAGFRRAGQGAIGELAKHLLDTLAASDKTIKITHLQPEHEPTGRGRPWVGPADSLRVDVSCTLEDFNRWIEVAKRHGLEGDASLSPVARQLLNNHVAKARRRA